MTDFPLETERLFLRPFALSDVPAYHAAIYADAAVMRYLPGGVPRPIEHVGVVIDAFQQSWERYGYGGLAVILKSDGGLIGHAGLNRLQGEATGEPEAELFYAVARQVWGQGLTTEAARAVARHGFETARLDHILALAVPENAASRRVMEKLGMTYAGIEGRYYGGTALVCYRIDSDTYLRPETGP